MNMKDFDYANKINRSIDEKFKPAQLKSREQMDADLQLDTIYVFIDSLTNMSVIERKANFSVSLKYGNYNSIFNNQRQQMVDLY